MEDCFRKISGFTPYPFQTKPAKHLLEGNNVLLRAPTGSGKTWTALLPFIYARQHQIPFADKMFYVLPLRTLTRSIYELVSSVISRLDLSLKVTIQMGNQPEDPFFKGDIIFTTIDQLLSNYIGLSLSASRKTSNVPPGSFLGAYIVIDEFHLLSPTESLTTLMDMVNRLESFTKFLLMTATVPDKVTDLLCKRTKAVEVTVGEEDVSEIPNVSKKSRHIKFIGEALTAEAIVRTHRDQINSRKTMAIFNTVQRAQEVYQEVKRQLDSIGCKDKLILVHSRFLPEDRSKKEQEVISYLSKDGKGNCLVIATQVVEVGLDISVNKLLTEMCPANSLLQRAGRCARYENEEGTVYVYLVPVTDQGILSASPYIDDKKMPIESFTLTQSYFLEKPEISSSLIEELNLVNRAHEKEELKKIKDVHPIGRKGEVETSLSNGEISFLRKLVRDVDSISLIIHPSPNQLDMRLLPERFSIPFSVLQGFIRNLLNTENHKSIYGYMVNEDLEPSWEEIIKPDQISSYLLICIHPMDASYDQDIGLILKQGVNGSYISKPTRTEMEWKKGFNYIKETYEEHILKVRDQFRNQKVMDLAAERFSSYFGISKKSFLQWIELTVSLHDIGKLNSETIMKYRLWQEEVIKDQDSIHDQYLAHTDYDDSNEVHRQLRKSPRYNPAPHAAEGALFAKGFLQHRVSQDIQDIYLVEEVTKALVTAITRHHWAWTKQVKKDVKLDKSAGRIVAQTIKNLGLKLIKQEWLKMSSHDKHFFEENLITPEKRIPWLLYWYAVRRLRMADWEALEKGGEWI